MDLLNGNVKKLFFSYLSASFGSALILAVYGVIINISTLVQSCSYGIGQAAQPLISANFGAGKA